jgi:hypothetical protein
MKHNPKPIIQKKEMNLTLNEHEVNMKVSVLDHERDSHD